MTNSVYWLYRLPVRALAVLGVALVFVGHVGVYLSLALLLALILAALVQRRRLGPLAVLALVALVALDIVAIVHPFGSSTSGGLGTSW